MCTNYGMFLWFMKVERAWTDTCVILLFKSTAARCTWMIKQLYKLRKLLVLHCNHTALIATEIALPFWVPHKSHRWMIAPLFQHLLKSLRYQQHLPVHVRNTFSPVVSTILGFWSCTGLPRLAAASGTWSWLVRESRRFTWFRAQCRFSHMWEVETREIYWKDESCDPSVVFSGWLWKTLVKTNTWSSWSEKQFKLFGLDRGWQATSGDRSDHQATVRTGVADRTRRFVAIWHRWWSRRRWKCLWRSIASCALPPVEVSKAIALLTSIRCALGRVWWQSDDCSEDFFLLSGCGGSLGYWQSMWKVSFGKTQEQWINVRSRRTARLSSAFESYLRPFSHWTQRRAFCVGSSALCVERG